MKKWIQEALIQGFHGKNTHADVLQVLKGLTAKDARYVPQKGIHSIWSHLFHMVFWYRISVQAIEGETIDWQTYDTKGKEWPDQLEMQKDANWNALVTTFTEFLGNAKTILETKDLAKPVKSFGDMTIGRTMLVLAQHNSYHIGQIVLLRKLQGNWPPPK